jgi:putative IMPACT (imprinted ancient) family translation regulator
VPEPVVVAIAAALAGRAAGNLYELVKRKFGGNRAATETLAAAEGAATTSAEVQALATALEDAERNDPAFSRELRTEWQASLSQHAETGGVINQVSGELSGKVVQARDVQGNVSL